MLIEDEIFMNSKRKLKLLTIVMVLLLTGCSTAEELAIETLDKNINKDCKKFETLVSEDFGGGENDPFGVTQIGYCDGKIIKVKSEMINQIPRKFDYSKYVFEYPDDISLKNIFGDTLFKVLKYEDTDDGNFYKGLQLDLVVNESKLNATLTIIENNFIPLISNSINENNITIYIYTTLSDNVNSDDVIVSYLIEEDQNFRYYENEKYNLVKYIGSISAHGYDTIYNTYQQNIIEQLNGSIEDFRKENNLY